MNYRELCLHILDLDQSIRFAAIATMEGKIIAAEYKQDVAPLLTRQESELSISQSLIRMSIRKTLEDKLGKTIYATAVYEKIKRATIMLYDSRNGREEGALMLSFDKVANHESIIVQKVLPHLREAGKVLQGE